MTSLFEKHDKYLKHHKRFILLRSFCPDILTYYKPHDFPFFPYTSSFSLDK